jgi:hypothetical protein
MRTAELCTDLTAFRLAAFLDLLAAAKTIHKKSCRDLFSSSVGPGKLLGGFEAVNEISILNAAKNPVTYLYLTAGKTDLFLVFDLATESLVLNTALEHWDDVIGCEEKFNNQEFPFRSANFSCSIESPSRTLSSITMTSDGCSITRKIDSDISSPLNAFFSGLYLA